MAWTEFCSLLSGISCETPLGKIVSIRAEDDPERIKSFNADQNRIRSEWRLKQATDLAANNPDQAKHMNQDFQAAMKAAFGGNNE